MAHRDRPPSPLAGVRRVPWSMIAACTERRRSGDWRSAYAAAKLSVDVDLDVVTEAFGPQAASRIADDLTAVAPDLLRQYLSIPFRVGTPSCGLVVLTRHPKTTGMKLGKSTPDEPVLALFSQSPGPSLRLMVTRPAQLRWHWELPVWCWHADAVDERRTAYAEGLAQAEPELTGLAEGRLSAGDLHPLVHDVLFPDQAHTRPAYAWTWEPVPVRCGSVWHELRIEGGRLVSTGHSEAELERELAVGGLGGPMIRCASVVRAWRTGVGWLPKRLRWYRADFFDVAARGHGEEVAAALAAGFDLAAADGEGAGLLHYAAWLGEDAVATLLTAGLRLDRRDKNGWTPLHWAYRAGEWEAVDALLAAGADPGIPDADGIVPKDRALSVNEVYAPGLRIQAKPTKPSMFGRFTGRAYP
ncbi:MAG: hypothetical protein HOV77_21540 [Hamadaea sp.]|uniref:ankyrin repeat domain-containing protein n=1 Tax=Hamadaea sp. TaxID=2024425 RepID=UPI0017D29181|nr:ankyrin repeat domain-containing protein [Hamadaea sp.]NUT21767.1 hypothetical protein [Hamadaea sp.]